MKTLLLSLIIFFTVPAYAGSQFDLQLAHSEQMSVLVKKETEARLAADPTFDINACRTWVSNEVFYEINNAHRENAFDHLIKMLDDPARPQKQIDEKAECDASRTQHAKPGVKIGMTSKTVLENTSWGKPIRINTTTTKYGSTEQWVYGGGYIYFKNGKVTGIQN